MKWGVSKFVGFRGVILAILIIAGGLSVPAYCKSPSVTLLLEQTPAIGGEITPVAGVYYYAPGAEVTLTAIPKPGYQFVHWLGEVSDPASKSTVVYLNKPKVIIAVFEQTDYGTLGGGGSLASDGSLVPTAVDFSQPAGFSSSGGGSKAKPRKLVFLDSGDAAPEVPEPATGILLALGSIFAFSRRCLKKLA